MSTDLVKIVVSATGAGTALFRAAPSLVAFLERRSVRVGHNSEVSLVSYHKRPPWQKYKLPIRWSDPKWRRRYWFQQRIIMPVWAVFMLVLDILLILYSIGIGEASLVYFTAAAQLYAAYMFVSYFVTIKLLFTLKYNGSMSIFDYDMEITVKGSRQQIFQHAVASALRIGGNLVKCCQESGEIEVAVGYFNYWSRGQRFTVKISPDDRQRCWRIRVCSQSVAPTYMVTFHHTERLQVERYLRNWIFDSPLSS